ncbi:fatty acid cis/trans isomerase [Oceanobacter mangrovi]|uniref:fatty acid cis/trans isomerase n=1 Tax=Oceanobacter mangrovi TaxID=2862510 RepID=UPI001FE655E5|nr:fatty acid cis/trans isomerase [Oceanobacter mangrovi]
MHLSRRLWMITLFLSLISGCAVLAAQSFEDRFGSAEPRDRTVAWDSYEGRNYNQRVKPILEQRCVSCHACYDAPCQLKLTSTAGLSRGINKEVVYDGTRLLAVEPKRLYLDAQTTEQWRQLGFEPVLNERRNTSQANLAASLIYQAISLRKQQGAFEHPILPDSYDFSLNRDQQCPTVEGYAEFRQQKPDWGMPYGLPELTDREYGVLTDWISRGAWLPSNQPLDTDTLSEVRLWEQRLNGDDLKTRLAARYIYEHIYLYSLYLGDASDRNAPHFRLVRSSTPPGEAIKIISTRRPYDDPGVKRVWYRLLADRETVTAKNHIPFVLDDQRWSRWQSYLISADFEVSQLPSYLPEVASNPFKAFEQLPADGRYRFLLEHARETIMAFIKGPVCRGQVAVNVINEQFWVYFVNPDINYGEEAAGFLESQAQQLDMPAEQSSNALPISSWLKFSEKQKQYLQAKSQLLNTELKDKITLDQQLIWDGEGQNPNAALTVMRHFDNATVIQGLLGQPPKTAWVIDYPLLERIHYLLVAGFDVYGNIGHQLVTRLYMDFLRMEGEMNFLMFLPKEERISTRRFWYRDADSAVRDYMFGDYTQVQVESGINFQTNNHQQELYQIFAKRLQPVINRQYELSQANLSASAIAALQQLERTRGRMLATLPEVAKVLITKDGKATEIISLVHNRGHANITSLLDEKSALLPDEDSLTLARGSIGDYPNVLMQVEESELANWAAAIQAMKSEEDYRQLLDRFGVRRSSPDFWHTSDQIARLFQQQEPLASGVLDYNRLENR